MKVTFGNKKENHPAARKHELVHTIHTNQIILRIQILPRNLCWVPQNLDLDMWKLFLQVSPLHVYIENLPVPAHHTCRNSRSQEWVLFYFITYSINHVSERVLFTLKVINLISYTHEKLSRNLQVCLVFWNWRVWFFSYCKFYIT